MPDFLHGLPEAEERLHLLRPFCRHRNPGAAAMTRQLRGNALGRFEQAAVFRTQQRVTVGMRIDKTGTNHPAFGINDLGRRFSACCHDQLSILHAHSAGIRRRAAAVNDGSVDDQCIEHGNPLLAVLRHYRPVQKPCQLQNRFFEQFPEMPKSAASRLYDMSIYFCIWRIPSPLPQNN